MSGLWPWALAVAAPLLLVGLLWAEREGEGAVGGSQVRVLAFKTPLSLLFVLTGLTLGQGPGPYWGLVVAGLILGLVGDVFLALKAQPAFRAGLVAFLLGHLAYVAAFAGLTAPGDWIAPGVVFLMVVSAWVYRWLSPGLGKMRGPVIAYIVVITVMVWAAWAAFHSGRLDGPGPLMVIFGALTFYASDLFVARDRFMRATFTNRLVGLPLYYAGQFLIALSPAWALAAPASS